MRSASHPPEYPQRGDEEQTGVEIAAKVLGRNNKNGQAPFYTGLESVRDFLYMKLIQDSR